MRLPLKIPCVRPTLPSAGPTGNVHRIAWLPRSKCELRPLVPQGGRVDAEQLGTRRPRGRATHLPSCPFGPSPPQPRLRVTPGAGSLLERDPLMDNHCNYLIKRNSMEPRRPGRSEREPASAHLLPLSLPPSPLLPLHPAPYSDTLISFPLLLQNQFLTQTAFDFCCRKQRKQTSDAFLRSAIHCG